MAPNGEAAASSEPDGSLAAWQGSTQPTGRPLADLLASVVADAAPELRPAAPSAEGVSDRRSEPARVLTLQIQSTDYGAVTVRLALVGNALSLRIAAEDPGAGERLRFDRDTLATHLDDLDYDVDVSVATVPRETVSPAPPPAPVQPAAAQAGGQPGSGGSTLGADRDPRHAQPQPSDEQQTSSHARESDVSSRPVDRRTGGLYV